MAGGEDVAEGEAAPVTSEVASIQPHPESQGAELCGPWEAPCCLAFQGLELGQSGMVGHLVLAFAPVRGMVRGWPFSVGST